MLRLWRFFRQYKKHFILGPMFKIVEAIFELIVPLVMASIIDNGVKKGDSVHVWRMGGVLLLLAAVGLASTLVCQYFASVASQGSGTALRNAMFAHIGSLSHAELDRFGAHTLIVRLTGDINQIQLAVAMFIRLLVRAPFLVIGAIIMALSIDWKLSIIVLAVTPLISLTLYFIISKTIPLYKTIQQKLDRISLITRENLSGARVIRAFSKQNHEKARFEDANKDIADTVVGVGKLSALTKPVSLLIMNAGITAVIWFGGYRVHAATLTQGQLIAFINYMTQIMLALSVVADLVLIFTKAAASASRVNEIFDLVPSVTASSANTHCGDNQSIAVKLKDVSFGYGGGNAVENINIVINRGQTAGIIGGTGSGKSTLINLIPRFYDADLGSVEVFGRDVRDYSLSELRRKIAVVPQTAAILSGTVAQNLRWGAPDATDDDLWDALEVAQAVDFIDSKPSKLNTRVEQNGRNFSGGQRQRLTIARAVAAKPEILILDDSFSALDAATDFKLRTALNKMKEATQTTVIMVSQRVGTIKSCDVIIVMDNGSVVGIGKHQELYDKCPIYREICESQFGGRNGNGEK